MEEISRAGFTKILNKPLSMKQLIAEFEDFVSQADSNSMLGSAKLIDETKFREVIEIYGAGETAKLLRHYHHECLQRLDALTPPRGDHEGPEHYLRELHTLRGSSALIGASYCADQLLELESLARAAQYSASFDGLANLRVALEKSYQEFQKILDSATKADIDA